jgi:hypothetical protein
MKRFAGLAMAACFACSVQAAEESAFEKAKESTGKAWDKTKQAVGADK